MTTPDHPQRPYGQPGPGQPYGRPPGQPQQPSPGPPGRGPTGPQPRQQQPPRGPHSPPNAPSGPPPGPPQGPPAGPPPGWPNQQPAGPPAPGTAQRPPDWQPPDWQGPATQPGVYGPPRQVPEWASSPTGDDHGPPDYGDDRDGDGSSLPRVILVIALAVVLVGGIAFGGWYFFLRDTENNSATGGKKDTSGPYEKVEELTGEIGWDVPGTSEDLGLSASWTTDRTVVLATDTELIGYDRLDGRESWSLSPPKLQEWPKNTENPAFCGASRTHRDGLVAVTYGWATPAEDKDDPFGGVPDCVGLAVVELDSGETVWSVDLVAEDEGPLVREAAPHPAIAKDAVAVKLGGHFRAFGLADGIERWQIEALSSERDICSVADVGATAKAFVGLITCSPGEIPLSAVTLDPASGDELDRVDVSLAGVGVEPGVATLVATEPSIVLHISVVDEQDRYLVLGENGTAPVKILEGEPGPDQLDMVRGSSSGSFSHFRVLVTDSLLVAATVGANDPSIGANKLAAYDLKTGERVWRVKAPTGKDTMLFPIAVNPIAVNPDGGNPDGGDGGSLLAIGSAWAEEQPPVGVFEVDLANGEISEFSGGYRMPGLNMSARGSSVLYHLGRLYVTTYIPVDGVARIYALH